MIERLTFHPSDEQLHGKKVAKKYHARRPGVRDAAQLHQEPPARSLDQRRLQSRSPPSWVGRKMRIEELVAFGARWELGPVGGQRTKGEPCPTTYYMVRTNQ